ncbi:VirB4 family type IV secretion system protein [Anaeromicropila herbilytica]|uniref:TraG P-loop domain-containing protein n=1 Tax=Anaeromicropila herbilytica TaxID=2785025 RepID=A0A7R7EIU7_9FIRM|nr:hypothetical protein [Anaeromicropila herbilytica]BCN29544.1 hypothetical protein bsdtb5_08390 [Anaeromicropila herbilytica]
MKKKESTGINNALLNVISPIGLEFKKNSLVLGENLGKIFGITKYPSDIDYGWLSKITNIPSTIASITFTPIENGDFVEALNKNISVQRGIEKDTKSTVARQRAKKAADDGEKLLLQIDQNGEAVGMLSTIIMPIATEKEVFNKVSRKTTSTIMASKCKCRLLSDLQKEGLRQITPMYTVDSDVKLITDRIAPLSSVMGGFANASSGLNDGNGFYVAKDATGGLVVLDFWLRDNDRTNSNFVVMGIQGQGKSTAVKHIAIGEYMRGTKQIFTDPEREYRDLCLRLGGDWINAGGGSNGRINPLQIRPVPRDDEDEKDEYKVYSDDGNGMGDLALYIKHLEVFFSLYLPSLDDMEKAVLKATLIELYGQFGITWDTDITKLQPTDFPIFSDLYNLTCKKAIEEEKVRKDSDPNIYKKLSTLLEDVANGSDKALWNGHTTIKTNSKIICLDTNDLQNTTDNIKRAQYFNINSWVWQEMSKDRNERVLAWYDEAYLMIDPKVPQCLAHLRNTSKRCRKYEAGIGIISHSVVDFLDPSIKMYGQALLDAPSYKIIFGTDGPNLKETKDLYKLTNKEEELLESKKKKHALMMIGSKRLHVNFEIPEYKFAYMGNAGGR